MNKKGNTGRNASRVYKPKVSDLADAHRRARRVLPILQKAYPDAGCALRHRNALQLLIATILSAQCTDTRVNIVSKDLFRKYRSAKAFAQASQSELEKMIKSTGFFRNKAKNIIAACSAIVETHSGTVPGRLEDLVSLAGVGRKTANVVLGNAFGKEAVVTDTHVIRLSRLMGFSLAKTAVKLEYDLMELFPKKYWTLSSHLLIFHGRSVCIASRPKCDECVVRKYCCFGKTS